MLGYLVNEELDDVVSKINIKTVNKKSSDESIGLGTLKINNHQVFKSNHSERKLKHLFFDFANN